MIRKLINAIRSSLLPSLYYSPDRLEQRSRTAIEKAHAKTDLQGRKDSARVSKVLERGQAKVEGFQARLDAELTDISDAVGYQVASCVRLAGQLAEQMAGIESLSFIPEDSREYVRRLRVQLSGVANELAPWDTPEEVAEAMTTTGSGDGVSGD